MSKIEVEKVTIGRWVILVGQNGLSLLEKGRVDRFDVIASRRWGVISATTLIANLISYIPETDNFDLVLDDHVTTISYVDSAVVHSDSKVTEDNGQVTVQFYDILKHRNCQLVSEKSDLDELLEAFSPFLPRIRRIVLRGPAQDFRYIIYVETSEIVKKPTAWVGSIRTSLSSVLINRPTAATNLETANTPPIAQPVHNDDFAQATIQPAGFLWPSTAVAAVSKSDLQRLNRDAPIAQVNLVAPADLPSIPASAMNMQAKASNPALKPDADPAAKVTDSTCKLTLIFSASDEPAIALLAAGVVWSARRPNSPQTPIRITEIGAYRKKLSSPFRRLVGVSAHHETDKLPMPKDRLQDLIQEIAAYTQQPGNHILFFGYEMLSTELLINISRFLQGTDAKYQILVCSENVGQSPELMDFESVFDGLAHKSWIYLENVDARTPSLNLRNWKTHKTQRLDDAILKKVMDGEFRIFEKSTSSKTNLSILQSSAFDRWLAKFNEATADS